MQIICVSRGAFDGGTRLAEKLASNLGYDHLSREELTDAATRAGIQVGRLEMAIVRRQPLSEQLAIEKERYRSFVSATLCERILDRNLVYHGWTGHLVLAGVAQALRIRVIQDPEQRTASTMERLDVGPEKARKFNEQVDQDHRRWVRTLYDVDWEDPHHYDAVINLSHMSVDNAASALVALAQLPEFQITPATQRVIRDLDLAARCRLAIGADQRTREMNVQVRSDRGRVWVTYLPRQQRLAQVIPDLLKTVPGVDEILCTMATTNILWIQERFEEHDEFLSQMLDIAGRWNAAVELIQLGGTPLEVDPVAVESGAESAPDEAPHGGILDDTTTDGQAALDLGLRSTHEALIAAGHAGGCRVLAGGARELVDGLERSSTYTLVVLGNVFQSKREALRRRLTRELVSTLSDSLRVPVIGAEELKSQYLFGPAQAVRLLVFGALSVLLGFLLFSHQKEVLEFLTREGTGHRVMATAVIVVFAWTVAYLYGNFTRMLLRLVRFE